MSHRATRTCLAFSMSALLMGGVAACGSSASSGGPGSDAHRSAGPSFSVAAGAKCAVTKIGPITRCENFYEAYWPTIKKNLQPLYQQALKADGGNLVVWGWDQLPKSMVSAFTKQFPGLKVSSRGLNFNLSSSLIAAKASGARSSDIVEGSITTTAATYDAGLWQHIDWTKYGVPAEYLSIGGAKTGRLPESINGSALQYNASKVTTPPTALTDLTDPKWRGKVAITNYNAQDFSGYGMRKGTDAMVSLIKKLKGSGAMTISNNTESLLSAGDRPVVLAGQLHDDNPQLKVAPFKDMNIYEEFLGVNTDAKNVPGAILYALWRVFDPAWVKTQLTDPAYASASQVFPGLPTKVVDQATGLQKANMAVWMQAAKDPSTVLETVANRDKFLAVIKAANAALTN